jgi:NAD(P)-dependent dehydrogenase (short-subunit alcohol dehydrogenase family)
VTKRLEDKVSIVTGAGQGIGASIARCCAAEGAQVVVVERNAETGSRVAAELVEAGARAQFIQADITDAGSIGYLAEQVRKRLGPPAVLINNAGQDVCGPALQTTEEDWRRNLAINLEGAWGCCRAVLPDMLTEKRGSIVNIASIHAISIIPGNFPYPVAKHALIGLTRALALEYAASGIRVNAISPGYINTRTEQQYRSLPNDYWTYRQRVTAMHPQKHLGEAEDVAWAAVFLASDEARFINAVNLVVDGGQSVLFHP